MIYVLCTATRGIVNPPRVSTDWATMLALARKEYQSSNPETDSVSLYCSEGHDELPVYPEELTEINGWWPEEVYV